MERSEQDQQHFKLVRLENRLEGGLIITRGVGEGIVIENFCLMYPIIIQSCGLELSIVGIEDLNIKSRTTPIETYRVNPYIIQSDERNEHCYNFEGTDYFFSVFHNKNHYINSSQINIMIKCPRSIKVLREELIQ